jgi:excinuclease ABC subunit A
MVKRLSKTKRRKNPPATDHGAKSNGSIAANKRKNNTNQSSNVTDNSQTNWLTVIGAAHNNLKNIDVPIPLARFVCITGVSGSGKSSLVNDILRETLARDLNNATNVHPGLHDRIDGVEQLDKIIDIDQSPIGRTPRSNPATYIKVFDQVRDLFHKLPDSKVRGYQPGRFSFNVDTSRNGGRCDACEGNGATKIEMEFLADVWVTCPVCQGRRFNRETLQIRYKGKNIADILEMDVQTALSHFANVPKIANMLQTLHDVGLDYIKLGQSSTTLSGGEAQRIKLARELVKRSTGKTLYLLDEPTTGLHFHDIKMLLAVLHRFVDEGNTVIVIEHNLDVIKTADWVIDLGPEGGEAGGQVVAQGTPEQIAKSNRSPTGNALAAVLDPLQKSRANRADHPHTKRPKPLSNGRQFKLITVTGARENNLKDITVSIPREKTTVVSGPSGSGKTSLALDTIYTEGQRRYVESLSSYARQFLGQLQKPRVDHITGLSPAISIEQKAAARSPRSTVGTITEIYDYMRVLWARIGQPYCPNCDIPIGTQSADEIVDKIFTKLAGAKTLLLAPVDCATGESYQDMLARHRAAGYIRVRIDGVVQSIDESTDIDARARHNVELVVDRLKIPQEAPTDAQRARLTDSAEQALSAGEGVMILADLDGKEIRFSQHHACDNCHTSYEELTPHNFSFNSRLGWCETCEGLGTQTGASTDAIIVKPTASIIKGAVAGWGTITKDDAIYYALQAVAKYLEFDLDTPWCDLTPAQQNAFLFGKNDQWFPADDLQPGMRLRWKGFYPAIDRATRSSWLYRSRLESVATEIPCEACRGSRLRHDARAVRVGNRPLADISATPLDQAMQFFNNLNLDTRQQRIAGELLLEIKARMRFLIDVGLGYLNLNRGGPTLSGGESQRIRLASQIGSGLTGVLYVLDEPTIGLHPRDNDRLIAALQKLRDLGNTLLIVEHDREVIDHADHLLDFGPGAGTEGGTVTAAGTPKSLRRKKASLTGQYLANKKAIPVPTNRRAVSVDPTPGSTAKRTAPMSPKPKKRKTKKKVETTGTTAPPDFSEPNEHTLTVVGARHNNLKDIDVTFPLARFTAVTGVSGSGKSSLINDILCQSLAQKLHRARTTPGGHEVITGIEHIDKAITVDQSPIGNTPSSNPATYTGLFDLIRELFAKLPDAKVRGFRPARFSFNTPGGRCEACEGAGQKCIEMHFLPDVWVQCEACQGRRYTTETLEIQYRGKSIADLLDMPVRDANDLFDNVPKIRRMLQTLDDVGLGYVPLGQPATTLSGGEAQRVKLAAELGRPSTGKTVYILDEPTTGLHFDDLNKLLTVLHRLVDLGNTVICVEHNLDVIKTADWVIDLGPEAGREGGNIVISGTPETVAAAKKSHTGNHLAPILDAGPHEHRDIYTLEKARTAEADLRKPLKLEKTDIRMPWEKDGRKWHTQRKDRKGRETKWSVELLQRLVADIEKSGNGKFAKTDWNDQSRIEITAPGNPRTWFAHIVTGDQWQLNVTIRTPKGTCTESAVQKILNIQSLDERDDLPIYGPEKRVKILGYDHHWNSLRIQLSDEKDYNKTAWKTFLKKAATAYLKGIADEKDEIENEDASKDVGRTWHVSQKAIRKGAKIQWESTTLMLLIGRLTKFAPNLKTNWQGRASISLRINSKRIGKIVTNRPDALRVEVDMTGPLPTPAQYSKLGHKSEIKMYDTKSVLIFWMKNMKEVDDNQLRELITPLT